MLQAKHTEVAEAIKRIEELRKLGKVIDTKQDGILFCFLRDKANNPLNVFSVTQQLDLERIEKSMRDRKATNVEAKKSLPKEKQKHAKRCEVSVIETLTEGNVLHEKKTESLKSPTVPPPPPVPKYILGLNKWIFFEEELKKICAKPVMIELSGPATSIEIQKVARGYVLTVGEDIFVAIDDLGKLVEEIAAQLKTVTAGV